MLLTAKILLFCADFHSPVQPKGRDENADIKIEKLIIKNPATADFQDNLVFTIKKMVKRKTGAILIIKGTRLVGIFTERDFLKLFSDHPSGINVLDQPIEKFMTRNPICAQMDEDYNTVYMKMKTHNIRHIPVMNGDKLEGIVSIRDLIHFYQNKLETSFWEAREELEELKRFEKLSSNDKIEKLFEEINKYKELSLIDHLTGLYNKRYFQTRINEEITRAKRYNMKLSLIFCDIDHFKRINDSYGHQCGDEVLREIAKILTGEMEDLNIIYRLRKSDIIARYGGEEFVIILTDTSKEGASLAAERIRKVIEKHKFRLRGEDVKITMSFGVAEFSENAADISAIIKNADYAMYKAKESGRNRVELYMNEEDN